MTVEQRRFSRVVFDVRAQLTIGEQTLEAAHIYDLGIGGCLLPVAPAPEVGSSCLLTIHLPGADDSAAIHVEGEVLRSDSRHVAIKFTTIDPDSLVHLQNIILHNTPDTEKTEEEIRQHPGLI